MIRSENRLIWFTETIFIRFMKHEQSEKLLSDQTLNISSIEGLSASLSVCTPVCLPVCVFRDEITAALTEGVITWRNVGCQVLWWWWGDLSFTKSSGQELCLCHSNNGPWVQRWVAAAWLCMCISCITHSFHLLERISVSHLCFNQILQHQIASCCRKNTNQIIYLSVYFSSVNKDSLNLL